MVDVFKVLNGGPINRVQIQPEEGNSREKLLVVFLHREHAEAYLKATKEFGVRLPSYPGIDVQVEVANTSLEMSYSLFKAICVLNATRRLKIWGLPGPKNAEWTPAYVKKLIV